ncbi:MAG: GFA family protein [Proteobacteria bacterium]|nr:GFA family protein [Pseudomonadota bacterium]MDA1308346.1 GFA family protein [Pseudomonadota bacterium]
MPDSFTGGCACGAIRYSASAAPVYMGNCHCRDCQQATGSAYFPAVVVKEVDFTVQSGTPSWYESPADKGHLMRRAFCSACGSPVFLINGARPSARAIYAGSLDDPSWYQPSRDIYSLSAQPWDFMHPDLPKTDGMP